MPLGVTYAIRITKETKSLICNVDEKRTTWRCENAASNVYYIVNLNLGKNKQKFMLGIDGIMLLTSPDGSVIFAEMEF